MEEKINIAAILKDKPQGTKLYSSACGKCELKEADDKSFKISFYSSKFGFMNGGEGTIDKNGNLYDDGECVIFPSREMRDWSKFAWKKGDVLVCTDGKAEVIFERFEDDNYTSFVGKHYLESYGKDGNLLDYEQELIGDTANYTKESDETIQCYINTIEERLGGKLNRETLEIEPAQPEFKDGDILSIQEDKEHYHTIFILKGGTDVYVFFDYFHRVLTYGTKIDENEKSICRLATEDEKKVLFDALAKEGKAWDAEKKQVVYLKPKVELKPFDKVLVRDDEDHAWQVSSFGYKDATFYRCNNGCSWNQCIPYFGNENLLGTTKNVEG